MLSPFELYIVDETNGVRSISEAFVRSDIGPVWSPDGAQIAYGAVSGGVTRTYLVDADGANRREVAPDQGHKQLLRWSPDGSRLAYLTYYQDSDGSISSFPYLSVTDVISGETQQAPVGKIQDLMWMPDGRSLFAVVRADDGAAIEVYGANGNHERRLAEADYLRDAATVTISPHARKVAYISPVTDEDVEPTTDSLTISALDGSDAKSVGTLWAGGAIVWSPDSTRIAFVALTNDYEYALYVANVDGIELQELMLINTGDESGEILPADPAWSPDGSHIAISSLSGPEGPVVFVMNADGTERRRIITVAGEGMIYDLAWRPGE
jgi:TolB protein